MVAVRISIHAPLRGRQDLPDPGLSDFFISIHAPLRGRPYSRAHHQLRPDFNPRPLAGATGNFGSDRHVILISIHAPLRGRPEGDPRGSLPDDFNPRPLAGATADP